MPRRLRRIRLHEVSLVDRPANPGAKIVLAKSQSRVPGLVAEVMLKAARSFKDILEEQEAREAAWEVERQLWPMFDALSESLGSIMADSEITDKVDRIRETTTQFLDACRERFPKVEDELEKVLLRCIRDERRDSMTDAEKKQLEELQKQVESLTTKLEKSQTALEASQREASLSADERAHADTLDDEARAEFVAKSEKDRRKVLDALKDDESLEVAGQKIYKSAVGDAMFAVMKAQQAEIEESRAATAATQSELRMEKFAKKADAEIANLPGERDDRAAALEAIDGLKEEVRKTIHEMLRAGDEAMKKALEKPERGHTGQTGEDVVKGELPGTTDAEAALEQKAKDIQAADQNLTFAKAYQRAIEENPELYNDFRREKSVVQH